MSTKSTPLGIFAGVGLGEISNETSFKIDTNESFSSHCALNFSFFRSVLNRINEISSAKYIQSYTVNTSLFHFANTFRYNERQNTPTFKLSEIQEEEFLFEILEACKTRPTAYELAKILQNKGYADDQSEALEYIDTLIESEIIVGELGLSLTRINFIEFLLTKLYSYHLPELNCIISQLNEISQKLDLINDEPLGKKEPILKTLEDFIIKEFSMPDTTRAGLTSTTLFVSNKKASLSHSLKDQIHEGLECLIRLHSLSNQEDASVIEFKHKFKNRYEDQEIPIMEALDPDIGIGFAQFTAESIQTNPIIKHFNLLPVHNGLNDSIRVNGLLLKKYLYYMQNNNDGVINITDEDLSIYPKETWKDLPFSFVAGTEIYQNDQNPLIFMKFAGGTSGSNLLSRFCIAHPDIESHARSMISHEEEALPETSILAEISYLPEEVDTSVILSRPLFCKYEIPYMNLPSKNQDEVIPPSDILISVSASNEIILRSKKLDKRIIPKNTSAHDYSHKTNPLYYFLSSLQVSEKVKYKFMLDWGELSAIDGFFPRVTYRNNTILILARWNINVPKLTKNTEFNEKMKLLKESRGIPDKVLLRKGFDNKILIDFNQESAMDILKSEIGSNELIVFEEYLFDNQYPLITSTEGIHNNEVFLSFMKNKEQEN